MLGGPQVVILLIAMGVIVLLLRWVFSPDGGIVPRKRLQIGPADYGLLVTAAVAGSRDAGRDMQRTLAEHGIRSTLTPADDGELQVRVFPADADRARELLA